MSATLKSEISSLEAHITSLQNELEHKRERYAVLKHAEEAFDEMKQLIGATPQKYYLFNITSGFDNLSFNANGWHILGPLTIIESLLVQHFVPSLVTVDYTYSTWILSKKEIMNGEYDKYFKNYDVDVKSTAVPIADISGLFYNATPNLDDAVMDLDDFDGTAEYDQFIGKTIISYARVLLKRK